MTPGWPGLGVCGIGVLPRRPPHARRPAGAGRPLHPGGQAPRRQPRAAGGRLDRRLPVRPGRPGGRVERLADPPRAIVSLTITEGGYLVQRPRGSSTPRPRDPARPRRRRRTPATAFGFVVGGAGPPARGGHRRRSRCMSCDNIQGNGDVARRMIGAFARLRDPDLADWMRGEVAFPNSMVDRITPVTADDDRAGSADRFGVEDALAGRVRAVHPVGARGPFRRRARPPLEAVGVQLVDDVEPYELMKLRLLNASHQALCYLGYLAGYRYAHEVCADPLFVASCSPTWTARRRPTLAGAGRRPRRLQASADRAVRQPGGPRHPGPAVRRELGPDPQVAAAGVRGEPRAPAARSTAPRSWSPSWARYAEGVDEQGEPIDIVDRRASGDGRGRGASGGDPLAFLRDRDLFGDLVDDERFVAAYSDGARLATPQRRARHAGSPARQVAGAVSGGSPRSPRPRRVASPADG